MYFFFCYHNTTFLKSCITIYGGMASHLDVAVYENEKELHLFAACTWEQFP